LDQASLIAAIAALLTAIAALFREIRAWRRRRSPKRPASPWHAPRTPRSTRRRRQVSASLRRSASPRVPEATASSQDQRRDWRQVCNAGAGRGASCLATVGAI